MGKLKTTQRLHGNCEEVNTKVTHSNEISIESSALSMANAYSSVK